MFKFQGYHFLYNNIRNISCDDFFFVTQITLLFLFLLLLILTITYYHLLPMRHRVVVALSGGIDSAVAALLLKNQGYQVEGVFMHNWDAQIEENQSRCNQNHDFIYAQRIASTLQIPLHRINFIREYWQNVFIPTLQGYKTGYTPNPDILCNREIKMGRLLEWAQKNRFEALATGHYGRIVEWKDQKWVAQARSLSKDQSYFLADIPQKCLPHLLLPIGDLFSKDQVRQIATENGLKFLLAKPESMGICFVGKRNKFATFLEQFHSPTIVPVIDVDNGKILGEYKNLVTIGQRIRIGGLSQPLFCVEKRVDQILASFDPQHRWLRPRSIVIKPLNHFEPTIFTLQQQNNQEDCHDYYHDCHYRLDPHHHHHQQNHHYHHHFLSTLSQGELTCAIRSSEKTGIRVANIHLEDGRIKITGEQSFSAPAPGQIAVLYWHPFNNNENRLIIASGTIMETIRETEK